MHAHESRPTDTHGRDSRRSQRHLQRGASAVEYGLLIAGIAAIIAVAVFTFGGGANNLFHGSCSDIFLSQSVGDCE